MLCCSLDFSYLQSHSWTSTHNKYLIFRRLQTPWSINAFKHSFDDDDTGIMVSIYCFQYPGMLLVKYTLWLNCSRKCNECVCGCFLLVCKCQPHSLLDLNALQFRLNSKCICNMIDSWFGQHSKTDYIPIIPTNIRIHSECCHLCKTKHVLLVLNNLHDCMNSKCYLLSVIEQELA